MGYSGFSVRMESQRDLCSKTNMIVPIEILLYTNSMNIMNGKNTYKNKYIDIYDVE